MSVFLILKFNPGKSFDLVFRYTALGRVAAEDTVLPLIFTTAISKGWFPEAVTAAIHRAKY